MRVIVGDAQGRLVLERLLDRDVNFLHEGGRKVRIETTSKGARKNEVSSSCRENTGRRVYTHKNVLRIPDFVIRYAVRILRGQVVVVTEALDEGRASG